MKYRHDRWGNWLLSYMAQALLNLGKGIMQVEKRARDSFLSASSIHCTTPFSPRLFVFCICRRGSSVTSKTTFGDRGDRPLFGPASTRQARERPWEERMGRGQQVPDLNNLKIET